MNVPTTGRRIAAAALAAVLFLSACDSRASRAAAAFDNYQAASAAGDLPRSREALLALVAANEDVPAYWVALGKVQYQLHDVGKAFYAFTRANELNRGDPEVVRFLTRIALESGSLEEAENRARELDLLAPGDPLIKFTRALVALKREDFASANQQADAILASAPFEPNGKVIKARALVGLGQRDAAVALLEQQVAQQTDDTVSLSTLIALHRLNDEWQAVPPLGQRILAIEPSNRAVALATIDAALRVGNIAAARAVSLQQLKPTASPDLIRAILSSWQERWKGPEPVALARRLALAAGPEQRVPYGRYLNAVGMPQATLALLGDAANDNRASAADAQAVYFDALAGVGRRREARAGLERILTRDVDNDIALGALAPLQLADGDKGAALNTARKLVTVDPTGVDSRLTLARCFVASGDRGAAERTLWDAFHDLRGEERIYTELRGYLRGDTDQVRRLDAEYADQRKRLLSQDVT